MDSWVISLVFEAPSACTSWSLKILRLRYLNDWTSFIHTLTNNLDKNLLFTTPDITAQSPKYKAWGHEIFTMLTNSLLDKVMSWNQWPLWSAPASSYVWRSLKSSTWDHIWSQKESVSGQNISIGSFHASFHNVSIYTQTTAKASNDKCIKIWLSTNWWLNSKTMFLNS